MQKLPGGESLLLPALRLHPCLTAKPKRPSHADLPGRELESAVSALRCLLEPLIGPQFRLDLERPTVVLFLSTGPRGKGQ